MTTDLNVYPYFDDYDESKQFYNILFTSQRRAVQVRELNQLQTILQNQITRSGRHFFKEGSMVIPGQCKINLDLNYVKVISTANLLDSDYRDTNILDTVIRGNTSGIEARVVKTLNDSGDVVLYIRYLSGDTTDGTTLVFPDSETLTVLDENGDATAITMTVESPSATGLSSTATIDDGVYFLRGKFVKVNPQTIILENYSNTPTKRVGVLVTENIVTADDDSTLYDNAQGSLNETAPGANRLKIDLVLTALDLSTLGTSDNENFIELLRVESGEITKLVDRTDYNILGETLARRTYDESGNYTVRPFKLDIVEFYNDGTNGGKYDVTDFNYTTDALAKQASIDIFGVDSPGTSHFISGSYRPGSDASDLLDLMQSKLVCVVESGKAYVRGFEIDKIAKSFINMDKARETVEINNGSIKTPVGNYIRVSSLYHFPDIKNYTKIKLYDGIVTSNGTPVGSQIGTARVRGIEYETGTIGTDDAIYRLYLFDVQTDSGKYFKDVKSVFQDDLGFDFTANIVLETVNLPGTISSSADAVTGIGTYFDTHTSFPLVIGDYIKSDGKYFKIDAVTNDNSLSLTTSPSPALANDNYSYVYARLYEEWNNTLLYPIINATEKIKDASLNIDTNYIVRRQFATQTANGSTVSFSVSTDEQFRPFSSSNYILINMTDNAIINVSSGDVALSLSDTQITFTTGDSDDYRLIAAVRKSQGTPSTHKSKTLISDATLDTLADDEDLNEVLLGKADIVTVSAIYMSDNFTDAATDSDTDITNRYTVDDGQRDNYYGVGKIVRKSDAPKPTGRLHIVFDYFSHGSNGNYFSVDTYTDASVDYEDVPEYISKNTGWAYKLRDCLDFRPRIDNTNVDFSSSGSSITEFVKDGVVYADYSYYLNRIDKLILTTKGEFEIIKGVSDLSPKIPSDSTEGMTTHILKVQAYTDSPANVLRSFIENKGYTMRDIGRIEKRVENLEYYTSLSLLEKETKDLEIKDADGLDRYKSGFIVDPFKGHGVGDVKSPDYKCSIDRVEEVMRPPFISNNVNLIEDDVVTGDSDPDSVRNSRNYRKTGDLFTLPYTNTAFVNQPIASSKINVNPFAVINFFGKIDLDPPNDEWKDVENKPDLIVNDSGALDSVKELADGIGTIWNEWETNWVGQTVDTDVNTIIQVGFNEPQIHRDLDGNVTTDGPLAGLWSRPGIDAWPSREVTITRTTTTTNTQQSRSGLRPVVTPKTITQSLGDKVVDLSYVPFIRSRDVNFQASGLKPNTRVYPFFDEVLVSGYVSAWDDPNDPESFDSNDLVSTGTKLKTDETGKVSGTFRIPNSSTLRFKTGRRLFSLSDSSSNDKINATTTASASYQAEGLLETRQETILSTRTAEITMEAINQERLLSDTTVDESYEFGVPIDPVAQSFWCLEKGGCFVPEIDIFMSKKSLNIPLQVQIREMVNGYPGKKVLPFSNTFIDPYTTIYLTNVVGSYSAGELITGGTSGATATVLYYNSTKKYLRVNIRTKTLFENNETITGGSGGATGNVVSIKKGVNTNSISNDVLTINGLVTHSSFTQDTFVPTRVTFSSPIYLQEGKEYCVVVLANSTDYEIWKATMAENMVGTEIPVESQPYVGSFFKSQNASTWNADQYSDMTLVIYKCVFDTGVHSSIYFHNDTLLTKLLDTDCLFTTTKHTGTAQAGASTTITLDTGASSSDDFYNDLSIIITSGTGLGQTKEITDYDGTTKIATVDSSWSTNPDATSVFYIGSKRIRVTHKNHGLTNGSSVTLSGVTGTNDEVNGIPISEINTKHTISSVELDSYVIEVSTTGANITGSGGGNSIIANPNVQMDVGHVVVGEMTFPKTVSNYSIKTVSGKSVHGSQTPYVIDSSYSNIIANKNITFNVPKLVASQDNEDDSLLSGGKSFWFLGTLSTSNANVSPVIDLKRLSLIAVGNRIDYPDYTGNNNINDSEIDIIRLVEANTNVDFVASTDTITSTDSNTSKALSQIQVGKYITITGSAQAANNSTWLVTKVVYSDPNITIYVDGSLTDDSSGTVNVDLKNRFISEITPLGGSASAKYLNRRMQLVQPATAAKIIITASRDITNEISMYYKTIEVDETTPWDEKNWTLATIDNYVQESVNEDDYKEYTYTLEDLPQFISLGAKIVIKSSSSAKISKIKDFRLIAIAD